MESDLSARKAVGFCCFSISELIFDFVDFGLNFTLFWYRFLSIRSFLTTVIETMASVLMDDGEIAAFIKEIFGVNLPRDSLSKPNYETMTGIYEMFLLELGVDNWQQPDLPALSNIDSVERFDDFIPKCNLVNCLRHLLTSMGCPEIVTLADLVNPSAKKTRRILNRLITLWLRLSDLKQEWEPIAVARIESEKVKEEILKRNQSLKETYAKKSLFVAQNKLQFNEMTKKLNSISEEHDDLKKQGTQLAENYRVKKQEMTERKKVLFDLDAKLGEGKEEINSLEMKIVKSPEKVMAEVNGREKELEERREESRKYQKEYMESLKKMDLIEEAIRDMRPAIETMEETFRDLNKFREKTIERESRRCKIEMKKQEIGSLRVVVEQSEMNSKHLKDQERRMRIQHENKKRPLNEMNEEIKQQIRLKEDSSTGTNKEQQKLLQKELLLTNQLQDLRSNRNKFDTALTNNCEKALKIVSNFKNQLLLN